MRPEHIFLAPCLSLDKLKLPCQGNSSATKQVVDECNTLNHDGKINKKLRM